MSIYIDDPNAGTIWGPNPNGSGGTPPDVAAAIQAISVANQQAAWGSSNPAPDPYADMPTRPTGGGSQSGYTPSGPSPYEIQQQQAARAAADAAAAEAARIQQEQLNKAYSNQLRSGQGKWYSYIDNTGGPQNPIVSPLTDFQKALQAGGSSQLSAGDIATLTGTDYAGLTRSKALGLGNLAGTDLPTLAEGRASSAGVNQADAAAKRLADILGQNTDLITNVKKSMAQDATTDPGSKAEASAIIGELQRRQIFDPLDPLAIRLHNLGIDSDYNYNLMLWKTNKDKNKTTQQGSSENATGGFLPTAQSDKTGGFLPSQGSFGSFSPGAANDFPNFVMATDKNGMKTLESATDYYMAKIANADRDPKAAADLMTVLAMTNSYSTDSERNAAVKRMVFDKQNNPVAAQFSKVDEDALKNLMGRVITQQVTGNHTSLEDIEKYFADTGHHVQMMPGYGQEPGGTAKVAAARASSIRSSAGRRLSGGRGGGGGGGGVSIIHADPEHLRVIADNQAQQELGRKLTDEEADDFAGYFSGLEDSMFKGNGSKPPDPTGQAAAYIRQKMNEEKQGQQGGQFVAALAKFLTKGAIL